MGKKYERVLATSDIHGQYDKFMQLLEKSKYNSEKDLLIVCGDMIDRGNQNLSTIYKCMELKKQGAIILFGNHEEFLLQAIDEMLYKNIEILDINQLSKTSLYWWIMHNGGEKTYQEISKLDKNELKRIYEWCANLPSYAIVNDWIFVHAGVDSKKTIKENTRQDLIWSRNEFIWCPAYKDKVVVFGHTPTYNMQPYNTKDAIPLEKSQIWHDKVYQDKIGIDCGGVYGGRLAMLELPSMEEFYV